MTPVAPYAEAVTTVPGVAGNDKTQTLTFTSDVNGGTFELTFMQTNNPDAIGTPATRALLSPSPPATRTSPANT